MREQLICMVVSFHTSWLVIVSVDFHKHFYFLHSYILIKPIIVPIKFNSYQLYSMCLPFILHCMHAIGARLYQADTLFMMRLFLPCRYAVFGLGSSAYPHFCAFAKKIDEIMRRLDCLEVLPISFGDATKNQQSSFRYSLVLRQGSSTGLVNRLIINTLKCSILFAIGYQYFRKFRSFTFYQLLTASHSINDSQTQRSMNRIFDQA